MGIWGSSLPLIHRIGFENAAHRARNHQILVRSNDANPDPAGIRGNHPRSLCIARLAQFDAEESQSLADARADSWRIFADTSREHERIQSTERGREGANPLFRLITEQRDGFRGSDIIGFL